MVQPHDEILFNSTFTTRRYIGQVAAAHIEDTDCELEKLKDVQHVIIFVGGL